MCGGSADELRYVNHRPRRLQSANALLSKHTLMGVFSMPAELFHPVGVITCVMVFDAHSPILGLSRAFSGYSRMMDPEDEAYGSR